MAVENPPEDLIHHSDQGVQYSCLEYQQRLWRHGMTCSMSRRGNCYDNAVKESFFHTLKVERVSDRRYATKREAEEDINWWNRTWYNQKRLHSNLGHVPPIEYERSKKVA